MVGSSRVLNDTGYSSVKQIAGVGEIFGGDMRCMNSRCAWECIHRWVGEWVGRLLLVGGWVDMGCAD